jgi:hypothetical protein
VGSPLVRYSELAGTRPDAANAHPRASHLLPIAIAKEESCHKCLTNRRNSHYRAFWRVSRMYAPSFFTGALILRASGCAAR